jgi:preprotein translocase subunit SecG
MGLISIVLLVILVISAVLLVLVVLVQDDQGEGIGGIFGGGSSSAFGSSSGNVLTRFTAALAAIFLVTCFGMAWLNRTPTAGNVVSKARQEALGGTDKQSWWVQAPSASGASATTANGVTAPLTGTTPLTTTSTTPAPSPSPAPSGAGGR